MKSSGGHRRPAHHVGKHTDGTSSARRTAFVALVGALAGTSFRRLPRSSFPLGDGRRWCKIIEILDVLREIAATVRYLTEATQSSQQNVS